MTKDVEMALRRLQAARARDPGLWNVARHEEALDIVLRSPDKTGNPSHIARNALRDADRKIQNRAVLMDRHASRIDVMAGSGMPPPRHDSYTYDEMLIDTVDMIRRGVRSADAEALSLALVRDCGDVEMSAALGINRDAARQRLCRARRRATTAWKTKH